ncbi:filamentous hemagglutinin N-terminal domain-containing protein [Variovorax dokdonensis]|uniref:Filamentous hemagglutinin N-terminal domain-containing protein n=1 Tax=Variovorax dokdonensis TaxID=344883 RepID=A0ABT7NAD6_9BURK|nr:filamentous hemagglutinin N-terminal domain-containing protein [Variovorax dokdonensis]MDM0044911.1 filamentous hemagglutinin N-terminal domain-containing protein [Variovorax dokdonensis]
MQSPQSSSRTRSLATGTLRSRRATAMPPLRLRPLALSLICLGLTPALAQTLPVGSGVAVQGTAAVQPGSPPNVMRIQQDTPRAIMEWQSFNVGTGNQVNVAQPSAASVLLNRVLVGGPTSQIDGAINANGHVYLINPSGAVFGPNSSINVGGFVASTLNIASDSAFMNGSKQLVFERDDGNNASVINQGTINVGEGGVAALMGASVSNQGAINVARGTGALVSARKVTVDFEGDGLTRFTIPADSQATQALVENLGSITADGGRVAMQAASTARAQVVNQQGLLQARSLQSRGGEIILGAGPDPTAANFQQLPERNNSMLVAGTLDVSASGTGPGGRINTSAPRVDVDATAQINAGGNGGANGTWTVNSRQDLTVSDLPPAVEEGSGSYASGTGGSIVNSGALGRALGRNTDVVLTTDAQAAEVDQGRSSVGTGLVFEAANVAKTEGGDTTLTLNSSRNLLLGLATVGSSSGALNIDMNADAVGAALPDTLPIQQGGTTSGGTVLIIQSTVETNGGRIRVYGQSDPDKGRAVGFSLDEGRGSDSAGVRVRDSLLSTCAAGQTACSGAGDIILRGQGTTVFTEGAIARSGVGVGLQSSVLRTGSGNIELDGRGGLAASGVYMDNSGRFYNPSIESSSGNITLTGSTRGWTSADPAVFPEVGLDLSTTNGDAGGGGGVVLVGTNIATGGNVRIDGQGSDLTELGNNPTFQNFLLSGSNSAIMGGSHGVALFDTNVTAGAGRQIDIAGTAGSNAFTVNLDPSSGAITVSPDTYPSYGVNVAGTFGNGAISTAGGRVNIDGRGSDIGMSYVDDSEGGPISMLDVSSTTGQGGSISVTGRNIRVSNDFTDEPTPAFINASGATGGGNVQLRASGSMGIGQNSSIRADTTGASGNGGSIVAVAQGDLRAYGAYSARGGETGGNGGFVETSGTNVDLSGIRVDASAPAGTSGLWLIDPFDITIANGTAAGTLPSLPFVPLANSVIQDGDINAALNSGTSVTITTGAPDPSSFAGSIFFNPAVDINVDTGTAPVTLRLEAQRDIVANNGDTQIRATSAPLGVEFAAGLSGSTGGIYYGGSILTNGGNVSMTALGGNFNNCTICLVNSKIDTRAGGSDANAGGNVSLQVPQITALVGEGSVFTTAAVDINGSTIATSTGNVDVLGRTNIGSGVRVYAPQGIGGIQTTSGNVTITGIGAYSSNSGDGASHGVSINGASVQTATGNIAVRGLRTGGPDPLPPLVALAVPGPDVSNRGAGVSLSNGALVSATGTGRIEVTGETQGNGAGVLVTALETAGSLLTPASSIDGNGNVVLRAANDGSSDALAVGGTVRAGGVLNLRPGGVDAASGAGVDRLANPIVLSPLGGTGFDISADELTRISAASMVFGSDVHAGAISVETPIASSVPLTLQNGGGGGISLLAPVSAPQLGLISGGSITQAAGANVTAGTLLAQSYGGDVILSDAQNNVSATTLGGGAAGRFEFVNAGTLRVGAVSITGWNAASEAPLPVTANSMAADTVLVRTLTGDLLLDTAVSSVNGADLVAANTFQNVGGGSLSGAPWRIWADTWVGETRGGLAGSGLFPNYYNCAFLGTCGVTITPGDNHFIYRQQPTLTLTVGDFVRTVGTANPAFGYTLAGLILGDGDNGITATYSTLADAGSPPGLYAIDATAASAAGYAVNVVPGRLQVLQALQTIVSQSPTGTVAPPALARFVDVLRDEPNTWVYDRNIGVAPICLATGPLDGGRALQGNDVLAREWSIVRTRPNLTSCLDTQRSNSCGDF